jgi:hypothetical protein
MFRYFLNETKQPISHVSKQIFNKFCLRIESLGLLSQEYFFIEYGHDGYQKNPFSVQISKKSSYLSDKMHLEKGKGKNVLKNL